MQGVINKYIKEWGYKLTVYNDFKNISFIIN